MTSPLSFPCFQDVVFSLQRFWGARGCAVMQPLDCEVGAGTFHPATFLRAVGPEPWKAAYVQPSRRPQDGRFGDNPNRLQHYYQFQVVEKPSPDDFQDAFLDSLAALGVDAKRNDIRFVEDNWESPTLGAWGLGWEVWLNGMEIAQFTYFQEAGGLPCKPTTGEITYGLERIAMFLQGAESVYDIQWSPADADGRAIFYRDVFLQNEKEQSRYNFAEANVDLLRRLFADFESESKSLAQKALPIPAYEMTMKCSHIFNLLDARGVVSATERVGYVSRVRALARAAAKAWLDARERQGFPMLNKSEKAAA